MKNSRLFTLAFIPVWVCIISICSLYMVACNPPPCEQTCGQDGKAGYCVGETCVCEGDFTVVDSDDIVYLSECEEITGELSVWSSNHRLWRVCRQPRTP